METNTFIPSIVGPSEGRSGSPADAFLVAGTPGSQQRKYAYERASENPNLTNPPFRYGIAGRLNETVASQRNAEDPRILRGYIRRSVPNDTSDPTSKYRLYFMFNPSVIERQFVSYLDQLALDPFNTIFDSGNLVAPPSVLQFSFEMFFDRQSETAADVSHPGVKVDFDYFDRVIRGVEPGAAGGGSEVSDNGVFLINPRSIKVVFSPDLVIEGRPYSAVVSYEKFDHRMTPTRVRISLTMMVQYVGVDSDTAFGFFLPGSVADHKATVAYEDTIEVKVNALANVDDLTFETAPPPDTSATPANITSTGAPGDPNANPSTGGGNTSPDGTLVWPTKGSRVTQEWSGPNKGQHPGIDLSGGDQATYAAGDGEIVEIKLEAASGGYGNRVALRCTNGIVLWYCHNGLKGSSDNGIKVVMGQKVKQGDRIGTQGTTGYVTGVHLHLEAHTDTSDGSRFNPRQVISGDPK